MILRSEQWPVKVFQVKIRRHVPGILALKVNSVIWLKNWTVAANAGFSLNPLERPLVWLHLVAWPYGLLGPES